jgi:YVTN family beta-propeller protein
MFMILKKMSWLQVAILGSVSAICLNPSVAQVPPGGAVYLSGSIYTSKDQNVITVLNAITLKSIATISIPGATYDYIGDLQVDSLTNRLYGTAINSDRSRTRIFAIDTTNNKVVNISGDLFSGLSGGAILSGINKIYITDVKTHLPIIPDQDGSVKQDAVVKVLDLKTFQPLQEIVITLIDRSNIVRSCEIMPAPDGKLIYVADWNTPFISIINTQTDTVLATIDITSTKAGYPCSLAVTPDGSKVFVGTDPPQVRDTAVRDTLLPGKVIAIDTASRTITKVIDLPGIVPRPGHLSISPDGQKLYVTNSRTANASGQNGIFVIDVKTLTVTKSIDTEANTSTFYGGSMAQCGYRFLFTTGLEGHSEYDDHFPGLISIDPAEDRVSARIPAPPSTKWESIAVISPDPRGAAKNTMQRLHARLKHMSVDIKRGR